MLETLGTAGLSFANSFLSRWVGGHLRNRSVSRRIGLAYERAAARAIDKCAERHGAPSEAWSLVTALLTDERVAATTAEDPDAAKANFRERLATDDHADVRDLLQEFWDDLAGRLEAILPPDERLLVHILRLRYGTRIAPSPDPTSVRVTSKDRGQDAQALMADAERLLLEARGDDELSKAIREAERRLASQDSLDIRASLLWKIGWAYSRWSRYREATGEFAKSRDIWLQVAKDPSRQIDERQLAWDNAARSRGAIALNAFRRGFVSEAEHELNRADEQPPAGIRHKVTNEYLRAIIGAELAPRESNREVLERPFREWFPEYGSAILVVTRPASLSDALEAARDVRDRREDRWITRLGNGPSSLADAQRTSGVGWGTIGDALMEMSRWYLDDDWEMSLGFALASLYCYKQTNSLYRFGIATAHAAIGRSLHRALKPRGDLDGFAQKALRDRPGLQRACSLIQRLLDDPFDLNPSDHAGLCRAARSSISIRWDMAIDGLDVFAPTLLSEIRVLRDVHERCQAERDAVIDRVLEYRMRGWASRNNEGAGISAVSRDEARHIYETARTLGCRRLQAQIAHEFRSLLSNREIDAEVQRIRERLHEEARCISIL